MNLEFRYRFEAAHRFLNSDSIACMTPHGHSWHATLCLQFTGSKLNGSQMAVEFSGLKKAWKQLTQDVLDHSYLHNINDPIVEVLSSGTQTSRLMPFPGDPTTELIALFLFNKMEIVMQASDWKDKVHVAAIKIEETPTNSIICDREFYQNEISNFENTKGWWSTTDITDRSFHGHI